MWRAIGIFTVLFIVSFLILSFPVGDKTIFGHVAKVTGPSTDQFYNSAKEETSKGWNATRTFAKKIFTNASPIRRDSVSSGQASVVKGKSPASENPNAHGESYSQEEVNQLKTLLKDE